jgi:hypothetical protein
MFIRERIRKLKDGGSSTFYQAVESKRQNGKVVKDVISLGEYPTIEKALEWELKVLQRIEKNVNHPITEYREIRHSVRYNRPVVVALPVKTAEKRRKWWLEKSEKQKARIIELQRWESRYCR